MLITSCSNEDENKYCSVSGTARHYNDPINAVKVTLVKEGESVPKHLAVTNSDGTYSFTNVEAGVYNIYGEKESYVSGYIIDDGVLNHRTHTITLSPGQEKKVDLLLNDHSVLESSRLTITDMAENPIESITIPKYASTYAFQLFNKTMDPISWQIYDVDRNVVSGFIGYEFVSYRLFSGVNPTSGTLQPGRNVAVTLTISPEVYTIESYQHGVYQISLSTLDPPHIPIYLPFAI